MSHNTDPNPLPSPGPDPSRSLAGELSVVLPTFNEAGNIKLLIERLLAALGPEVEIIVVDDSSPDGTGDVVRQLAGGEPAVRLVERRDERGLTSAIVRGVSESSRKYVAWMDCDLSMPPEDLPRLLAELPACDVAIGSRYAKGGRDDGRGPLHSVLSRSLCLFARIMLLGGPRDFTSGFIVLPRSIFLELGLRGDYGEYCVDFLHRARRGGYRLKEVPFHCQPRHSGDSKTGDNLADFVKRGRKYLATVFKLAFERPVGGQFGAKHQARSGNHKLP